MLQKQCSVLKLGFGADSNVSSTSLQRPGLRESHANVTRTGPNLVSEVPEIRKYKKCFNSEILCAMFWGIKYKVTLLFI